MHAWGALLAGMQPPHRGLLRSESGTEHLLPPHDHGAFIMVVFSLPCLVTIGRRVGYGRRTVITAAKLFHLKVYNYARNRSFTLIISRRTIVPAM
jgi:hypothetical protein